MGALVRPHTEEATERKNRQGRTYKHRTLQLPRLLNLVLGEGLDPVRPPPQASAHSRHRRLLLGRGPKDLIGPVVDLSQQMSWCEDFSREANASMW